MTLELAKYLVKEGMVTPSEMDDVLQRQVIFGGSVDTNILELSKLDEQTLTEALSKVHKLPMATTALLSKKNPKVANLLPARLAEKYQVLPVTMAGRNIVVLTSGRIDPINEEKLGFILSLKIKTYLVCEVRLQQYLSEWLNVYIEPRYKALLTRMGSFDVQPTTVQKEPTEPPIKTDEIPSKETKPLSVDQNKVQQVLSDVEADEQNKQQKMHRARSGRILTDEAIKACFQARHRDVIVDTTLRYARQFLPFVGLFVIDDDHIMGWDAVGSDNARSLIRKIRIPARISTVLSMVVNTRAYYLGPMPKSQPNQTLLRSLQRPHPPNILVVPIILKKRLIGLLFGDSGDKAIKSNRLGELLLFINVLPQAFEHLLLRKKAEVQSLSPPQQPQPQPESDKKPNPEQHQKTFTKWVATQRPQTPPPERAAPEVREDLAEKQPPQESTPQPEQPEPLTGSAQSDETSSDHSTDLQADPQKTLKPESSEPEPEQELPSPQGEPPPKPEENNPKTESPEGIHASAALHGDAPHVTQPMFERLDTETPVQHTPQTEQTEPNEIDNPQTSSENDNENLKPSAASLIFIKPADTAAAAAIKEKNQVSQTYDLPKPTLEPPVSISPKAEGSQAAAGVQGKNILEDVQFDQLMSQADTALEARQIDQLVEQLISSKPDLMDLARKNLLDIGPRAIPTIMNRFPGNLNFDIRKADGWIPPITQHSELIRCVIEMGTDACAHVAKKLEHHDPTVRYYALKIMGEIACPAYFDRLIQSLYDRDALVRTTAVDVLQVYRGTPGYKKMLVELRGKLDSSEPNQQAMAAALLGNLKDTLSMSLLVDLIGSPSQMVVRAAVESLRFVTKQDFQTNQKKWRKWLKNHKDQQRIQWLIAGLRSKDPELRYSASQELEQATDEAFDYYFDSGKRQRNRAVRKWESWWKKFGRHQSFDEESSNHPE